MSSSTWQHLPVHHPLLPARHQETSLVPTRKPATPSKSPKKSASKTKSASKKSAASKTAKKKVASPKKKTPGNRKKEKAATPDESQVTIDRRTKQERREEQVSVAGSKLERREKVTRRRQIDPTTCERDYSDQEVAFMSALDEYKRKNGRMFPTCSEVLEVIRDLGYVQLSSAELAARAPAEPPACEWSLENEEAEAEAELVG